MSSKGRYFLLMFSHDPPAADIIRNDALVTGLDAIPGDECNFQLEMSRDRYEEVTGVVVDTGLKKNLKELNVSAAGLLIPTKGVGTRKQEVEKKRMEQVNAQKLQLQQLASQLVADGADGVCENLQPVVKVRKQRTPSLPKKRSEDVLSRIKALLENLPCFTHSPQTIEIYKGTGIYVDFGKFSLAKLKKGLKPADLHRRILKLALPQNILRLDGVACTSKRGCIGIPSRINEGVVLAVSAVFQRKGGKLERMRYDPDEILRNLIDNTKATYGTRVLLELTPPSSPPLASNHPASNSTHPSPSQPSSSHPQLLSSPPQQSFSLPQSSSSPCSSSFQPSFSTATLSSSSQTRTPNTPDHQYTDISFNRVNPIDFAGGSAIYEEVIPLSRAMY